MRRAVFSRSLIATLFLAASAAPVTGCQLIAGLGGEQPLGAGGSAGGGGSGGDAGNGGTGLTGSCTPDMTDACYTGPEATKGKGLCQSGTATCQKDGMWGTCDGEVLPQAESCAAPDDEDCNGFDCTVWVKSFTGDLYANAVGVDGQGNVYAIVAIAEGIDFGDGMPVVPVGNTDVVLLKYDRAGELLYKRVYPTSGDQFIRSMTVDKSGTIVIGGETSDALDLGGVQAPAGAFVAKLDADGKGVWARGATGVMGGSTPSISYTAIDSKGNVFAGGNAAAVDFGTGLLDSGDFESFFVAKLDSATGNPAWVKISKGGMRETLAGMAVDPSDSLVLTGTWNGMYIKLAGTEAPPNDLYNCCNLDAPYLLRLDPAGAMSDGKMLAGYQATLGGSVSDLGIDKFGVSTLVGSFTGILDLSSNKFDSGMNQSLFIVHDQTSSFNQWSKAFIQDGSYNGAGLVAIDGHDNMVIQGTFSGPTDFGGGPLGEGSSYVLKLDKDGKFLWNRTFKFGDGGISDMVAGSLEDETVLTGTFYQHADLGMGSIDAQQGVFVAKLGR